MLSLRSQQPDQIIHTYTCTQPRPCSHCAHSNMTKSYIHTHTYTQPRPCSHRATKSYIHTYIHIYTAASMLSPRSQQPDHRDAMLKSPRNNIPAISNHLPAISPRGSPTKNLQPSPRRDATAGPMPIPSPRGTTPHNNAVMMSPRGGGVPSLNLNRVDLNKEMASPRTQTQATYVLSATSPTSKSHPESESSFTLLEESLNNADFKKPPRVLTPRYSQKASSGSGTSSSLSSSSASSDSDSDSEDKHTRSAEEDAYRQAEKDKKKAKKSALSSSSDRVASSPRGMEWSVERATGDADGADPSKGQSADQTTPRRRPANAAEAMMRRHGGKSGADMDLIGLLGQVCVRVCVVHVCAQCM